MSRICFTDYEDMEKQTHNLLLSDTLSVAHGWIRAMLETMETALEEAYEYGYEAGERGE